MKVAKTATKKGGAHSSKGAITPQLYERFNNAFDRLNNEFWKGKLPPVILTFVRKPNSMGYFAADRWEGKKNNLASELALNPDWIKSKGTKEALQTIGHEMVHLWQFKLGKKCPKKVYHNAEFRDEMKRIGLITSSTGAEGGKQTGQKMSDYIEKGGPFEALVKKMLKEGFDFDWSGVPDSGKKAKKGGKRVKYVCTEDGCGFQCWAKHDANVLCGGPEDDEHKKPVQMEADGND